MTHCINQKFYQILKTEKTTEHDLLTRLEKLTSNPISRDSRLCKDMINTFFFYACANELAGAIKPLMDAGADYKVRDEVGHTAFGIASGITRSAIIQHSAAIGEHEAEATGDAVLAAATPNSETSRLYNCFNEYISCIMPTLAVLTATAIGVLVNNYLCAAITTDPGISQEAFKSTSSTMALHI